MYVGILRIHLMFVNENLKYVYIRWGKLFVIKKPEENKFINFPITIHLNV